MYRKRVRKIRVVTQVENPGEIVELEAEAKPCETYILTQQRFKRNPNKKVIQRLNPGYVNHLELFYYLDNPAHIYIALNGKYCFLDYYDLKSWYQAVKRALSILKNANRPQKP